jgi:hypothetical protein
MKVKALVSFAGAFSMGKGEVREVDDSLLSDLISCGYVEEVKVNDKKTNKKADTTEKVDDNSENK